MVSWGDPGRTFRAPTPSNPDYVLDTAAGRYLVLCFLPCEDAAGRAAVEAALAADRALFDDRALAFFGVLRTPALCVGRVDEIPGVRWFFDVERRISRLYGFEREEGGELSGWVVLDPSFRVMFTADVASTPQLMAALKSLPVPDLHAGSPLFAPVLVVPRIFEPDFCTRLIAAYEADGGEPSGFMREIDGKTVMIRDRSHKVRSDHVIADEGLRQDARARIVRRLVPQIAKAFSFQVTRMERDIVACYDGEEGGFFRAHRDNTTGGTAHRRFAVTINLNAEAYEGGDLVFPEFGSRTYRAPTGGAVVFSCSLLHAASPVTRGRRYAYLPFLYDEAAARQREENNRFLGEGVGAYRAGEVREPIRGAAGD